jgi:uncharacterized protein
MQTAQSTHSWMLRLEEGETLPKALEEFAREQHVRAAAVVMGIGLLRETTIGFWNGQEYETQLFGEPHELVSATGSIAEVDGQPSVHLHVSLGGKDHRVVGGHLVRGTVGLLAEMLVEVFPDRVFGRPLDESRGLRMLDLRPGPAPM